MTNVLFSGMVALNCEHCDGESYCFKSAVAFCDGVIVLLKMAIAFCDVEIALFQKPSCIL